MRKVILLFFLAFVLSLLTLNLPKLNNEVNLNVNNYNHSSYVNPSYSINYINYNKYVKLNNKVNKSLKENCKLLWRYSFKCALEYALNYTNLEKVRFIAKKLEGNSVQQKVWNVLKWEDKNIKYNWSKATLQPTVIEYVGSRVKIIRKGIWYQTPEETIEKRSGICGDYAILTAALLIDMNVTPYVAVVNFTSGLSHAAVLVKIDGWFFVLDQHLPPMDLGTYYKDWLFYRTKFGCRKIVSLHIFRVIPGRVSKVIDVGFVNASEMKKEDYNISYRDLKALSNAVMLEFEKKGLNPDYNLKGLKPGSYLPAGYTSGKYWTFKFPHYADYYNPVFYKQYSKYFFSQIYRDVKIDAESCNSVWVNCSKSGSDLIFHVLLAKKY